MPGNSIRETFLISLLQKQQLEYYTPLTKTAAKETTLATQALQPIIQVT